MYTKVWTEINYGKGEDANPPQTEKVAAVFDGLGGTGGFTHRSVNKTSAYMGSRIFARGFENYFAKEGRAEEPFRRLEKGESPENVLKWFGANLGTYLSINGGIWMQKYKIRFEEKPVGKSTKLLPTTMAGAVFCEREENVEIISIWAGDSRTFLFNADGLKQISMDDEALMKDEKNRDYWEFLHLGDVRMSNLLSMSDAFCLRLKYLTVKKPCLVINGTDGTFGYVKEPLDLEKLWMDAVLKSGSLEELSESLKRYYVEDHHDDCSMTIHAFGFADYEALKTFVRTRYQEYTRLYLEPLEKAEQYRQLEEEKKAAAKRLVENEDGVKRTLMPYVEKSFLACMDGGKEAKKSSVENSQETDSVENLPEIDFFRCPKVQEVLKKLEREEVEQDQALKYLNENDGRKELLREIQKNKNWIPVRMAFEAKHKLHDVNRKSDESMSAYRECVKQYEVIESQLNERMSEYQQNVARVTAEITDSIEQMKKGTAEELIKGKMKNGVRKIKEYAGRCEGEYKKNHRTLVSLKKDMDKYASKVVEEDMQSCETIQKISDWILEKDVRTVSGIPESVNRIKNTILENGEKKSRIRSQIDNRQNVREQAYRVLLRDEKEELYLWAVSNYSDVLLKIFKEKNPNEMLTEELEREIGALEEKQKAFAPYKNVTWKSLWEAYQPGFEEYLHLPCVVSNTIVPREEYQNHMEKIEMQRRKKEAAGRMVSTDSSLTDTKTFLPERKMGKKAAEESAVTREAGEAVETTERRENAMVEPADKKTVPVQTETTPIQTKTTPVQTETASIESGAVAPAPEGEPSSGDKVGTEAENRKESM